MSGTVLDAEHANTNKKTIFFLSKNSQSSDWRELITLNKYSYV
jgi:hypothetical protein